MATGVIRFYFDYESPNAYLAWTQLPALAARYDYGIEPVPVLYAGLLDAHEQLGPGEVSAKGRWMANRMDCSGLYTGRTARPTTVSFCSKPTEQLNQPRQGPTRERVISEPSCDIGNLHDPKPPCYETRFKVTICACLAVISSLSSAQS